MAEFLDTQDVSAKLSKIINNAESELLIISPYLRFSDNIKERLEERNSRKINVWVIYGKNELRPEENNWLRKMDSIKTCFLQNLHAKCYMNESEALVTSMNLHQFSQENNREMGIAVSCDEEPDLYDDIKKEAYRIRTASKIIQITVDELEATETVKESSGSRRTPRKPSPTAEAPKETTRKSSPTVTVPQKGFCIRCKVDLAVNPAQPYCLRCFRNWNRYKNKKFKEKYCHVCGAEHTTSMLEPLCLTCDRNLENVKESLPF